MPILRTPNTLNTKELYFSCKVMATKTVIFCPTCDIFLYLVLI